MKKLLIALSVGALMIGSSAMAEGQSNNNPGALKAPNKTPDFPSCWYEELIFDSESDVFTFNVERTKGTAAGVLRVQTKDCCIAGDKFMAEIEARKPRFKTDVDTSDGNIYTFNGDANVAPFKVGTVTISYTEGVDVWPAGMTVQFCYSRERKDGMDEITITNTSE